MKKKATSLAAGLQAAAGRTKPTLVAAPVPTETKLVFIGGQWPPEVRRALKLAEAASGKRLKQLLSEGINVTCAKYGVAEPCTAEE